MSWIFQTVRFLANGKNVRETAGLLASGVSTARQYAGDFSRTHFAHMWKEANAGDVEAQFQLGECYFKGRGIDVDPVESARWYERAAQGGHAQAQCNLAMLKYLGRGTQADPAEAWMWMKLALIQNDLNAVQSVHSLKDKISPHDRRLGEQMAAGFTTQIYVHKPETEPANPDAASVSNPSPES